MNIRATEIGDLPAVMEAYDYARRFMRANGNMSQWANGYPSEELIRREIAAGHSFVCTDSVDTDGVDADGVSADRQAEEIVGTFCFILGDDPTYKKIYEGEWLNDEPYGVVHRLASNGRQKGLAHACFEWCARRCTNLRVDTHRDNIPMQRALETDGFHRCGIIYIADGTERIAFQKSLTNLNI